MQAAITHPATTTRRKRGTGIAGAALAQAKALLRAFARSCQESRLPETARGSSFSLLPHSEQDRWLNRGYRP